MPTYEYQCVDCHGVQEMLQSMKDAPYSELPCPVCQTQTKHERLISGGATAYRNTDIMDAIRAARKKHGFPENRGPQQDAADKYMFQRNAGTGKYRRKKP